MKTYLESNEGLLELAVQSALVLGSVGGRTMLQKKRQKSEKFSGKKKRQKKRQKKIKKINKTKQYKTNKKATRS